MVDRLRRSYSVRRFRHLTRAGNQTLCPVAPDYYHDCRASRLQVSCASSPATAALPVDSAWTVPPVKHHSVVGRPPSYFPNRTIPLPTPRLVATIARSTRVGVLGPAQQTTVHHACRHFQTDVILLPEGPPAVHQGEAMTIAQASSSMDSLSIGVPLRIHSTPTMGSSPPIPVGVSQSCCRCYERPQWTISYG